MLQCAIAFLLIAGKSWNRLDRLVVTTDEVDKPSYGVYKINSRHQFPHSKYFDQLKFRNRKILEQGTYYMPYCSEYLNSAEIASLITKGLTEITHQAYIPLTHERKKENNCLQYLSAMTNPELEYNTVDIPTLGEREQNVCTVQIIMGLALKGIIAVDGPYKAFAPQMADHPVVVTYNQPLQFSSLILDGEMFAPSSKKHERTALAWYQGHLHLFKQNLITGEWSPVTPIGSELMSGSLITNHILEALPASKQQWIEFYKWKTYFLEFHNISISDKQFYDERDPHKFFHLIEMCKERDKYFISRYPFCLFECGTYVGELHKYYNSLNSNSWDLRRIFMMSESFSHQKLNPFRARVIMSALKEKVTTKT